MNKLIALATCSILLSGCDVVSGTSESVAFSDLTLISAPLVAEEDGTAPDLYVEVKDAAGRTVVPGAGVVEDADEAAFPLLVASSGSLVGSTRDYFVVVMDRDADGYDIVAVSEAFSPDDLRAGTEPVFEISSEDGSLRAELAVAR